MEHGPSCCDAPTVKETELQNAVVTAINKALGGKDDMLVALEENIAMVFAVEDEGSIEPFLDRWLKHSEAEKMSGTCSA